MGKQIDEGWRQHVLNNVLPRMEASNGPAIEPAPANPQPFSAGVHLQPQQDVIERLPEERKDLVRKLRQRSADQHAVIPAGEDVRQASLAKIDAENLVKELQAHPQNWGENLPPDHPLVLEATKALEKVTADFERLKELQETRTARWQAASQAKAACEDWLRHGVPGGTHLEAIETEPPKVAKSENIADAIERHRRRVRELKADLHRIASAPFPSSYSKQRLREMVEQLAARGTPDVTNLIEHDRNIIWPTLRVQSEVHGAQRSLAFHEAIDVVGLFAAILKPAMISFLDTLVDADKDDAAALSHEARQQAEAEAMADLLDIERQEAALIWSAQAQGLPIEFRSDISPLAILQVRLVTTPGPDALPETSDGHSWPWKR